MAAPDLSHWEEEIPASALDSDWYETFSEWFRAFLAWAGVTKGEVAKRTGKSAAAVSQVSKRALCTLGFAEAFHEAFRKEGVRIPDRLISSETRGRR